MDNSQISVEYGCISHTDLSEKSDKNHLTFPKDSDAPYSPKGMLFLVAAKREATSEDEVNCSAWIDRVNSSFFGDEPGTISQSLLRAFHSENFNAEEHLAEIDATALVLQEKKITFSSIGGGHLYRVQKNKIRELTRNKLSNEKPEDSLNDSLLSTTSPTSRPSRLKEKGKIQILESSFQLTDVFVLTSHNISHLTETEIMTTVVDYPPQTACQKLLDLVNTREGGDNLTIMVIRLTPFWGDVKLSQDFTQKKGRHYLAAAALIVFLVFIALWKYGSIGKDWLHSQLVDAGENNINPATPENVAVIDTISSNMEQTKIDSATEASPIQEAAVEKKDEIAEQIKETPAQSVQATPKVKKKTVTAKPRPQPRKSVKQPVKKTTTPAIAYIKDIQSFKESDWNAERLEKSDFILENDRLFFPPTPSDKILISRKPVLNAEITVRIERVDFPEGKGEFGFIIFNSANELYKISLRSENRIEIIKLNSNREESLLSKKLENNIQQPKVVDIKIRSLGPWLMVILPGEPPIAWTGEKIISGKFSFYASPSVQAQFSNLRISSVLPPPQNTSKPINEQ